MCEQEVFALKFGKSEDANEFKKHFEAAKEEMKAFLAGRGAAHPPTYCLTIQIALPVYCIVCVFIKSPRGSEQLVSRRV